MSLCRAVPHFKRSHFKLEGGSRNACHSSLESTPCCEFPGDSPQSLNTDVLSLTSSLGSITDQLSTESPDQESNLSSEVNGVLQESSDPEAFGVLEVPEPTPDLPNEDGDGRTETSRRDRAGEMELHGGASSSLSQGGEDGEGGDATELEEEPCSADEAPNSRQSPCQEQDSSAEAQEAEVLEPDEPRSAFSEAPLLHSPPVPSSLSWAPNAEGWLLGTRADEGSTEELSEEQGFLMHVGDPGHLGSDPWHNFTNDDTVQKPMVTSKRDLESVGRQLTSSVSALAASTHEPHLEQPSRDQVLTSSDEEDIYAHGLPSSSSETSVTELGGSRSLQDLSQPATDDTGLLKSDQVGGLLKGHRWQTDYFSSYGEKLYSSCRPWRPDVLQSGFGGFQHGDGDWLDSCCPECPCSARLASTSAAVPESQRAGPCPGRGGALPGGSREPTFPWDRCLRWSQQEPGPCRQLSPSLRAAAPGPPGCAEPGWGRGPASCGPTQPMLLGDEYRLFLDILCERVIFKKCFFLASNYYRDIWFQNKPCAITLRTK